MGAICGKVRGMKTGRQPACQRPSSRKFLPGPANFGLIGLTALFLLAGVAGNHAQPTTIGQATDFTFFSRMMYTEPPNQQRVKNAVDRRDQPPRCREGHWISPICKSRPSILTAARRPLFWRPNAFTHPMTVWPVPQVIYEWKRPTAKSSSPATDFYGGSVTTRSTFPIMSTL